MKYNKISYQTPAVHTYCMQNRAVICTSPNVSVESDEYENVGDEGIGDMDI